MPSELHVHYRYLLDWARRAGPGARILDFGCGQGQVVKAARAEGLDLVGADVKPEFEGVHEIRDDRLPFEDRRFDLVLSNQVFEHVPSLERSLDEVARVLKPGGRLVCLFPTAEVLREAHCGVPFLHWLPRGWRRTSYAALWHRWGHSFDKDRKPAAAWAAEAVEWMDRFVFYRRRADVLRAFARRFGMSEIEEQYLAFRWPRWAPLWRIPWARAAGRALCRRLNGVVLAGCRRV